MLFNSLAFAVFLPIVFAVYWLSPSKYRWVIILISSYYFYMSWNPKYIVLIMSTTLVSYFAAIGIEKTGKKKTKKTILVGATLFCLGLLFFFKYFNFIGETVVSVAQMFAIQLHPVTLDILLPVGISFYTFQTLSYVIDVYRGEIAAERSPGIYAAFISFFPQLVAGPIERANNLLPQICSEKHFDYDQAMYGARKILWGLFKKIAVADVVSGHVDLVYADLQAASSLDCCAAIFLFTIQIYCDFSGYSDIAIGTAKLFGISLMDNFKSPYFSLSIREFWSRWHISLSTWFRDYVYIPLGGNRCARSRHCFNLMVTFVISGLWHGASWTFVLWGALHGLAQVAETLAGRGKGQDGKIKKVLKWIVVFAFCNVAWVFFRAETFGDAFRVLNGAFGSILRPAEYLRSGFVVSMRHLLYMAVGIGITAVYDFCSRKSDIAERAGSANRMLVLGAEYVVLGMILVSLYFGAGANPFVYFQF